MSITVFQSREDFQQLNRQQSIGFVPTMGNLHDGHLSLLERALKENTVAVISIFVNPTQFAPGEDFSTYPRTFEEDLSKIEKLATRFPGKDVIVFSPKDDKVIYQEGEYREEYDVGLVKSILEGQLRPTFFDGVTKVVRRLFAIVQPNVAYFGQKDFQQLFIIKKMVRELELPIKIEGMPIIREKMGLAMSSRNQYLDEKQKLEALKVYKTLDQVARLCQKNVNSAQELVTKIVNEDNNWNYLTLRNPIDLSSNLTSDEVVILANYQMGATRLLDNMVVKINEL